MYRDLYRHLWDRLADEHLQEKNVQSGIITVRHLLTILLGVIAVMALPLSITQAAVSYPYFGPQSIDDEHIYFGNEDFPRDLDHGIRMNVDVASTSFQSIVATISMDYQLIERREITDFYITANGRIVDHFNPTWDQDLERYRAYYYLRIALEDWNIGSNVTLQVIGVHHAEESLIDPRVNNRYVVAWSERYGPFQLKPLPVIDRDAITVLEAILAKLEQLKQSMENKLDQLNESVKKIYEIPPPTQARFDAALANLQSKLPTEQLKNEAQQMENIVKNSANRINNTPQKVKFGEINWMGVVVTPAVDFTDFMTEITTIRRIAQITLWCEFFYFVILVLRPRLTA